MAAYHWPTYEYLARQQQFMLYQICFLMGSCLMRTWHVPAWIDFEELVAMEPALAEEASAEWRLALAGKIRGLLR